MAAPAGSDAVTLWNTNAGAAATKACIAPLDDPLHELRMYAMMHVAIHDALNAIDRRFRPYTFDKLAEAGASPDAAVAAAARDVLVPLLGQLPRLPFITQSCVDVGVASVEAADSAAFSLPPNTPAKAQGIAVGKAAAAAILALRATDGPAGPFLNPSCHLPRHTGPTGSPAAASVNFTGNPNPGDAIKFSFNLPDGNHRSGHTDRDSQLAARPRLEFTIGVDRRATLRPTSRCP